MQTYFKWMRMGSGMLPKFEARDKFNLIFFENSLDPSSESFRYRLNSAISNK